MQLERIIAEAEEAAFQLTEATGIISTVYGLPGQSASQYMATVLKGYTYGAAYVYQAEDRTGSIEAGKCANLIVLDQNLFTIDPEMIPDTKVLWNIFEGQTIYDRLNNLAGASGI